MSHDDIKPEDAFVGAEHVQMPYGKHKGRKLGFLPMGYLSFLLEETKIKDAKLRAAIERVILLRLLAVMRRDIMRDGETLEQANARHERELVEMVIEYNDMTDEERRDYRDCVKKRRHRHLDAVEFAYKLLAGDPMALDVLDDVLARG